MRATLIWSLLFAIAWTAFGVYNNTYDWRGALLLGPVIFFMFFGTMLLSNRVSAALARRVDARNAAKAAAGRGPSTTEPSSERAEHNQRRRQRADRARAERRDRRR